MSDYYNTPLFQSYLKHVTEKHPDEKDKPDLLKFRAELLAHKRAIRFIDGLESSPEWQQKVQYLEKQIAKLSSPPVVAQSSVQLRQQFQTVLPQGLDQKDSASLNSALKLLSESKQTPVKIEARYENRDSKQPLQTITVKFKTMEELQQFIGSLPDASRKVYEAYNVQVAGGSEYLGKALDGTYFFHLKPALLLGQ